MIKIVRNALKYKNPSDNTFKEIDSIVSRNGETGNKGETGDKGLTGNTTVLSVGTVVALANNETATVTINTDSETGNQTLNFGLPKGIPGDLTRSQFTSSLATKASSFTGTIRDSYIKINDGADNAPIRMAEIALSPIVTSSNVPIKGRTSIDIIAEKTNYCRLTSNVGSVSGISVSISDNGYVILSGTSTGRLNREVGKWIANGNTVYIGRVPTGTGIRWRVYDETTGTEMISPLSNPTGVSFTPTIGHNMSLQLSINSLGVSVNMSFIPMISEVYIDTPIPYDGTVYTVDFPSEAGIVYSGTLVVNGDGTGTLTVDRYKVVLDGTQAIRTVAWQHATGTSAWIYPYELTNHLVPTSSTEVPALTSNALNAVSYDDIYSGTVGVSLVINSTTGGLCVRVSGGGINTEEAINAYLSSSPIEVVYPIETPDVYNLTVPQVKTVLGVNNICMINGNNVSFTYNADTEKHMRSSINKVNALIAGVEDEYKATKNYPVGSYFIVGDTLYKASTAIANNETITPSVNCLETSVQEQLLLLATI